MVLSPMVQSEEHRDASLSRGGALSRGLQTQGEGWGSRVLQRQEGRQRDRHGLRLRETYKQVIHK